MITDEQLKSWRRKIVLDAGSYTPEFEGEAVEAFILLVDEVERLRGVVRDSHLALKAALSIFDGDVFKYAWKNADLGLMQDTGEAYEAVKRAIEATKDGSR